MGFKKGQDHGFGFENLRPWSQSNYAWRWSDPKYDSLPPDALSTIQAVAPEALVRLYPRLRELEIWAQEKPDRVIQTAELDEGAVARALEELSIDPEEPQLISWNDADAVLAPWRTFVRYWSSFCYPSSDDVAVVPQSGTGVLSYHHAEYFCWRARRPPEGA